MRPQGIKIYLIVVVLLVLSIIAKLAGTSLWDFFFQIVLTAVGIVLALAYADLGKPSLSLEALDPSKVFIGNEETLWIHLKVFNRPLKSPPFISRSTAFSCHGTICFMDMNKRTIFDMDIRWSNNPQPIKSIAIKGKIVDVLDRNLIRASGYIDIPADEGETLDVCFRDPKEKIANGWNSYNYEHPKNRHPDRNLSSGDYIVRVVIKHNDGAVESKFLLHNPENINGYKLVSYSND